MVVWKENIGKLDISKSKGIRRHSFSPSIIERYNRVFLPFYSFIAMRHIQRLHKRWVKAFQSLCLPLMFSLIYSLICSSVPIFPPPRAAVTNPSLLLCLRGQYLQPSRSCASADLLIICQKTLTQAIPLAISISMTKHGFYASGFQPHKFKCCAGPLSFDNGNHWPSASCVYYPFSLNQMGWEKFCHKKWPVSFADKHTVLAELREIVTKIQLST